MLASMTTRSPSGASSATTVTWSSAISMQAARTASTPAGMTAAGGCNGNSNADYSFTEAVTPGTTATRSSSLSGSGSWDAVTYVVQPAPSAPTVTAVTPSGGPTGGGNTVTITGYDFSNVSAVKFGTTNASSYTVTSPTTITATVPAGTGTKDVLVTNNIGTSANTAADDYTYYAAPTITSLSPNVGTAAGGTSVVITGTDFVSVSSVKFGATNATGFTVNSATQITATAPAGTGTQNVSVTAVGGTNANTAADDYTYVGPPTITGLSLPEIESTNRRTVLLPALLFCLSFTLIFTVLGMTATGIGHALDTHGDTLQLVSGALMVVFGVAVIVAGWSTRLSRSAQVRLRLMLPYLTLRRGPDLSIARVLIRLRSHVWRCRAG